MVDTDIVSTHTYTAGGRDEQALLLLPPDAIHVSACTISVFSCYCRRLYSFLFFSKDEQALLLLPPDAIYVSSYYGICVLILVQAALHFFFLKMRVGKEACGNYFLGGV
jgi:hypothetical protein